MNISANAIKEEISKSASLGLFTLHSSCTILLIMNNSNNTSTLSSSTFLKVFVFLQIIYGALVIVCGCFGNFCILITLKYHKNMRWSTKVFYIALAVCDLIYLNVFGIISWSLLAFDFEIYRDSVSIHFCKLFDFVSRSSEGTSSWIVFFLALERYILTAKPNKITIFDCKGYILLMLSLCFFMSSSCSSVYFFRVVSPVGHCGYKLTIPWSVAQIILVLGLYLLPNTLAIYPTVQILKILKKCTTRVMHQQPQPQGRQVLSERVITSVKITLVVISLQMLLTMPSTVTKFFFVFENTMLNPTTVLLILRITLLIQLTNHAVNFYFYLVMSRQFRHTFLKLICCKNEMIASFE